ncbi:MAG TPA: TlpA disulfide reductase family protein [Candidatus Dormibacteraeota bacterium]|nr:TlpA disulfide reductase family protein [Candidatus Dormibacteraeota bacterium]
MIRRGRFLAQLSSALALTSAALAPPVDAATLAGDRARAEFAPGIIAPGHPMPAMTAPMPNGRELSLASLRGHAVWINCFATWCEPCNAEMPLIVETYRRSFAAGLRVVGISMSEHASALPPFLKRYGITFPVVLDHAQATNVWGISDIPTSIFLDARGVIRTIRQGEIDRSDAAALVAAILAHRRA